MKEKAKFIKEIVYIDRVYQLKNQNIIVRFYHDKTFKNKRIYINDSTQVYDYPYDKYIIKRLKQTFPELAEAGAFQNVKK
ncbi:MAG: hypothetical protein QW156_04685 [Candidatus Aenigmatarchaeota archaeon]